ncbi:hypothetical protein P3T37_005697 [Kitasatospora sp. MAA4]|uniref:hypothetical protein n=1 Tax=Kitasatospora sp. MAA4 TaxID=3035093 RepID=UPI00247589EA|nr:hypothetical protein [Kitasatospora sp. MAA4]MDH6136277.1 hypothetical protein [Kitasatospora sp. MAA4]
MTQRNAAYLTLLSVVILATGAFAGRSHGPSQIALWALACVEVVTLWVLLSRAQQ